MNRQPTNQMRGWEGGLGVAVYSGDVSGCEPDLHLYVVYIYICNHYEPPWRRVCVWARRKGVPLRALGVPLRAMGKGALVWPPEPTGCLRAD